jgi:type IV pilus assembly protein PilO
MKSKIDVLIFFVVLILGGILFIFPSYSSLMKEKNDIILMKKELSNIIDELSKLKDTLSMLSKERESLLAEGQKKIFDKKGFSIFLKELSIFIKRHNLISFSILPEEPQEAENLPEGFPFKIKRLPINFMLLGRYQEFLSFFQDLELQNYPIRFLNYKITSMDTQKNVLSFQGKIEIYLLEEEQK